MNDLDLLQVYQFNNKVRCGTKHDGGYVIGELDGNYDCYISAGVGSEESFSRDFINKYNMNKANSFAFDGTIRRYPYSYTRNISFIRRNINSFDNKKNTNLDFFICWYNRIFLKMDIEGGEYPWLLSLSEKQLGKFKQIVIEFHGITGNGWKCKYNDKMNCLRKLASTHYMIHAHGNNWAPVSNSIPDVIELTYVNKNCFVDCPEFNTTRLPTQNLDYPNNPRKNDIDLNLYPFVTS